MYEKKEYKTLRVVAKGIETVGWFLLVLYAIGGFVFGWKAQGIVSGAVFGIILSIVLGIPTIVMGQLIGVFLDMKVLLENIAENTKRLKLERPE